MAKKTRVLIRLRCKDCDSVNYYVWKRKTAEYKLKLKKFCKNCKKHTEHKESKK